MSTFEWLVLLVIFDIVYKRIHLLQISAEMLFVFFYCIFSLIFVFVRGDFFCSMFQYLSNLYIDRIVAMVVPNF